MRGTHAGGLEFRSVQQRISAKNDESLCVRAHEHGKRYRHTNPGMQSCVTLAWWCMHTATRAVGGSDSRMCCTAVDFPDPVRPEK